MSDFMPGAAPSVTERERGLDALEAAVERLSEAKLLLNIGDASRIGHVLSDLRTIQREIEAIEAAIK